MQNASLKGKLEEKPYRCKAKAQRNLNKEPQCSVVRATFIRCSSDFPRSNLRAKQCHFHSLSLTLSAYYNHGERTKKSLLRPPFSLGKNIEKRKKMVEEKSRAMLRKTESSVITSVAPAAGPLMIPKPESGKQKKKKKKKKK